MLRFGNSFTGAFSKNLAPTSDNSIGGSIEMADETSFEPQTTFHCHSDMEIASQSVRCHEVASTGLESKDQNLPREDKSKSNFPRILKKPARRLVQKLKSRTSLPRLNAEFYLRAFLKQCHEQRSFFTDSICFDDRILSAAYVYYRR